MATVTSTKDSYRVEPADAEADRDAALGAWDRGGLGTATGTARARYDWFYLNNPQGNARLNLLFHSGNEVPIGSLGIAPRVICVGDRVLQAGTLVDYVVTANHRSVYPALLLQREGRARALLSLDILYGLPDTKAVAICKRLETHVNLDLPRFARVLRTRNYLNRILPGWLAASLSFVSDGLDIAYVKLRLGLSANECKWVDQFDAGFDRFWAATDKQNLVIGIRDQSFLKWRFTQQPGHGYQTFLVARDSKSDPITYFVCEKRDMTLSIKDLLSHGSERDLVHGLLALIVQAREMGMSSIDMHVLGTDQLYRALRKAGFSQRSTRPFFAVVPERLRDAVAGATWYITQADEDV